MTELYVLLEGTGRLAVDGEVLTLSPLSAVLVDPETVRQPFNDTDAEQLWLVVGTPAEAANTLEMTPSCCATSTRTARARCPTSSAAGSTSRRPATSSYLSSAGGCGSGLPVGRPAEGSIPCFASASRICCCMSP